MFLKSRLMCLQYRRKWLEQLGVIGYSEHIEVNSALTIIP